MSDTARHKEPLLADPVAFLHDLFHAGLAAADPLKIVPPHLPPPPKGRLIVIGAGKASAAMAQATENHYLSRGIVVEGLVVTRYGYGMATRHIEIVEAAHPVPDDAGEQACLRMLELLRGLTADDLVLCLISGGGSALLSLPAPCLDSAEKRDINKFLLRSGAPIYEMNCVRKHLSRVKGGHLALAAAPAAIVTLIISDVPGDDPHIVASGPTLPDPTTGQDALAVIDKYGIPVSQSVRDWLADPSHETPKPDMFPGGDVRIIAKAQDALDAAAAFATRQGVHAHILGDDIEGDARETGVAHVHIAKSYHARPPFVLLSGGETTVTVTGNGRGGRNSEYILAAALESAGSQKLYGIACDTDGIDGSEHNAGAFFTPHTLKIAAEKGCDLYASLDNNDSYSFFETVGGLVVTGPTFTNVNDFRALLVLP